MNEIIYLEPSEEITSVIDRLRAVPGESASFVIPRGATIAQSIVNLKLLKRSAQEMNKEISLVATDRISRNLASQIGLTVYSKVSEAQKAKPKALVASVPHDDVENASGMIRVNNYYRNKNNEEEEGDAELKGELEQIANDQKESEAKEAASKEAKAPASAPPKSGIQEDEEDEKNNEENIEIKKRPIEHDNIPPKDKELNHPSSEPKGNHPTNIRGPRKIIFIFASIFILFLLASAYLLLPRATAKIQVKTEDFSAEKSITVDTNATAKDAGKLILPGKLLTVEKELSKSFDATGRKDVGTKATGTLSFSNNAGVDDQIPAGTTVKSSGGVEFTVDAAITVPKASLNAGGDKVAGKANGKVTAKNPGEKSNLPSATVYSVTGKPLITASGETSDGVSKEIKVVTADDLSKAEINTKDELSKSAKSDLIESAKNQKLNIFEDSIKNEIISSSSSKKADDQIDKFDFTVKLKFYVIGYSKSDLDSVLIDSSEKSLKANRMIVVPDKAEITYTLTESNIDTGTLKIDSKLVGKSGPNMLESTVKGQIKGKSVSSAKNLILKNKDVEKVEIDVWPNFLPQVPFLSNRIKVTFGFAE